METEIFENNVISQHKKKEVSELINQKLQSFVITFIDDVIKNKKYFKHITNRSVKYFAQPTFKNKSSCYNYRDVEGIDNKQLIYYNENNITYCLEITKIAERFKNNNFLNPYTSIPLS